MNALKSIEEARSKKQAETREAYYGFVRKLVKDDALPPADVRKLDQIAQDLDIPLVEIEQTILDIRTIRSLELAAADAKALKAALETALNAIFDYELETVRQVAGLKAELKMKATDPRFTLSSGTIGDMQFRIDRLPHERMPELMELRTKKQEIYRQHKQAESARLQVEELRTKYSAILGLTPPAEPTTTEAPTPTPAKPTKAEPAKAKDAPPPRDDSESNDPAIWQGGALRR